MTNLCIFIVFLVPTTLNKVPFTLLTYRHIIPGQAEVAGGTPAPDRGPALFCVFPVNTTTETAGPQRTTS